MSYIKHIDREALDELINYPKITNMGIMIYLFSLTLAQNISGEVQVRDITPYSIHRRMEDKMPWISKSGFYSGYNMLCEAGFLFDTVDFEGHRRIIFQHMGLGHLPGSKGYLRLEEFLFSRGFHQMSLRSKKVILLNCSRLNNNPNKTDVKINIASDKGVNLKKLCKVNRLAHLVATMAEVGKLLKVVALSHFTYSVRHTNVTSLLFERVSKIYTYTTKDFGFVKSYMDKLKYLYNHSELQDITQGLVGQVYKVRREVLERYVVIRDSNSINHPQRYVEKLVKVVVGQ